LQVATGNLMTALLYDMGVYTEIRPVVDTTVQLAAAQDNGYVQSQVLGLRAGGEYFGGDKAAALADCRKASSLIDPAQDPSTAVGKLTIEAFVAISADAPALSSIRNRVDGIVGHMANPSDVRYMQDLVHALAAAAAGDHHGAQAAIEAAAGAPQSSRDMVRQFALPIEIMPAEPVRAEDGPALSSRNQYLSTAERREAPRLYQTLSSMRAQLLQGSRDMQRLELDGMAELARHGWRPDYIGIRRQADLQAATGDDAHLVIVAAARLGGTRLIDNIEVELA
jgi:hypothetical protein